MRARGGPAPRVAGDVVERGGNVGSRLGEHAGGARDLRQFEASARPSPVKGFARTKPGNQLLRQLKRPDRTVLLCDQWPVGDRVFFRITGHRPDIPRWTDENEDVFALIRERIGVGLSLRVR
jgi:hypothetical protein